MRSTKFYPTKLVSSLVLLLLLMNVFSAFAQDTGPNITKTTTCIDHNPGTVGSVYTYTFNSAVSSSPTWTVKGDIQLLDAANNVVGSLTGTTAKIRSTAGYGKGRLIATYAQTPPCGAKQEYVDVYKEFSLLDEWPAGVGDNNSKNTIIGPKCLSASGAATYTYSINSVLGVNQNQEIGIDSYIWDYPASWTDSSSITKYISGDVSSITFTRPASFADGDVLKVWVGKCNPVPYTIALYNAVPKPVITPLASCVPTTSTSITLSVQNPSTDYEYDWILPANSNWYFTDGSNGTNRPQATITIDNATFDVKVKARRKTIIPDGDACNATESDAFTIKRAQPAGSVIIGPA